MSLTRDREPVEVECVGCVPPRYWLVTRYIIHHDESLTWILPADVIANDPSPRKQWARRGHWRKVKP